MKKVMFAVIAAASMAASAEMKVGTVDMLKLVRNHPSYETNKSLMADTEKDYQKKLDAIKSELEAIQEEGKKLGEQLRNPILSQTAKAKMEKDLMDIQNKFLAGQQRLRSEGMRSQQNLQELEGRLLKATTEDLRKKINAFATANGYDYVFDSSATPFHKPDSDVTPGILKAMGVDPAHAKDARTESEAKKNEGK